MLQSLRRTAQLRPTAIFVRLFSSEPQSSIGRRHSSIAAATQPNTTEKQSPNIITKQSLFNEFFRLGPNVVGKVPDILHLMIRSGKRVSKPALIGCLKDLRKHGRYQLCLEIMEWVEKGRYKVLSRDYALHLNILYKLKGIDEVEKFFESIPPEAKDQSTYGALLHSYCCELDFDKAVAVFEKMDEIGCASSVLTFCSLMSMYLKGGQPEKVPALVEELKHRNITLDAYAYSVWIQSYRLLGDIDGSERVIHEVQEQDHLKDDWRIQSNVAAMYIGYGESEKAISALKNLEDVLDSSSDTIRDGYLHLISLYAGTGAVESVYRVWDKLLAKFKGGNNLSYLTMLQALAILDDMEGLVKYFREWESSCKIYDARLAAVLIGAYLKHDMVEEAELLLRDVTRKAGGLARISHVKFMNYYFEKRQTDSALKHMGIAIAGRWKPLAEKLEPCFRLFKEEKDIDGAEEFCRLLKKAQSLDARAYFWLLQTYADANVVAPDMRQRIEDDDVDVTPELEELLERVCPN